MPANKENNQVSGGQSLLEKVFRSVEKRVFEVEKSIFTICLAHSQMT